MIEADFFIRDNAQTTEPIQFVDEYGEPFDFTGSTWTLTVKTTADAPAAALTLTTGNGGIAATDPANGTIAPVFGAGALAAGAYVYDLIRFDAGGVRTAEMAGKLTVEKGITP